MSMYKTIADAQLQARKQKNAVKASLLTTILGEFARGQTKEVPTDAQVFSVLTKMQNSIKLSIDAAPSDALATEMQVVTEFLALKPALASPEETRAIVVALSAEHPTADMGFFMKHLRTALGDKFDGAVAKQVVTTYLSR